MRRLLILLVASLLVMTSACGGGDDAGSQSSPSPTPEFEGILLRYSEVCAPCGAAFTATHLFEEDDGVRFRVRLEIRNTGERGKLDFTAISSFVYAIDASQIANYEAGFPQAHASNRIGQLLNAVGVEQYTFAYFLDESGSPGIAPVLDVGESWEGWLMFYGPVPPETAALLLQIRGIEGSLAQANTRLLSGWVSFTENQPYIAILRD